MSTHLYVTDTHAHPDYDNNRADWLGKLILDVKPDVFVHGGDGWDMPALCGYDRGKKTFEGRRVQVDIDSGLDFQERTFAPIRRAKKKRPRSIYCYGNHDQRLDRIAENNPEYEGMFHRGLYDLERHYDDVVYYNGATPGIISIDGISYAHYFTSGVMGRPISGEHPSYTLLAKRHVSCSAGHVHTLDFTRRNTAQGNTINGLLGGCYFDWFASFAGEANSMWSPGVAIKRNVEDGNYDLQWVSMDALRREYA